MPRGIVIPADADAPLEVREFATLEDYQSAVGGYIELVDIDEHGATMYVDEEGLLRQLPFNPRAPFFWWFWQPGAKNTAMLVGDAVLIGAPDEDGDTTDIPEVLVQVLLHEGKFRVEVKVTDDPSWHRNDLEIEDCFDATVWAMALLERWTAAERVRVLPIPPVRIDPNIDPTQAAFVEAQGRDGMSAVHTDDTAAVWLSPRGVPERLVWRGVRYRVSDFPTPLGDMLLGAITHPPAAEGWRFQGTNEAGESRVFDVRLNPERQTWALLNVWD
jgi:hypothetical protein